MIFDMGRCREALERSNPVVVYGRITRVIGSMMEGEGVDLSLGDLCQVTTTNGSHSILAEVVGFRNNHRLLTPLGDLRGIGPGSRLEPSRETAMVPVGPGLLGRVLNEFGQPIDGKGPVLTEGRLPFRQAPGNPMKRLPIRDPLATGVRAIDGPLTCGKGQRMGIFAGSGVGKSVLMGMIARNTSADVNVIALIGERGREIREFVESNLKEEGLRRSVVIAVPSDKPPMARVYAALAATTISEYFCGRGQDVMLMLDSSTRIAMALREVGLGMGEPPTSKGYTPSVFSFLPQLLERAGLFESGSITAFYTVLVEGDDMDDPVADTMRSLLDGHVILSRKLATQNHYPSIDVTESISRCMVDVVTPQHRAASGTIKEWLSIYHEAEDLIKVGAYTRGNQAKLDEAIDKMESIKSFLIQKMEEKVGYDETVQTVMALAKSSKGKTKP